MISSNLPAPRTFSPDPIFTAKRCAPLWMVLLVGTFCSLSVSPLLSADYTWSPESLYKGTNPVSPNPWTTKWVEGPDGGKSIEVSVMKGTGYYNYIVIPRDRLPEGTDFTAEITFRVTTPTSLPKCFHLFARNSKSEAYDLWQKWIGEPGESRTIQFPMQLKPIEGGKWTIYMGCQGTGAIIIDKLVIRAGRQLVLKQPGSEDEETSAAPTGIPLATGAKTITVDLPTDGPTKTISAEGRLIPDGGVPVTDEVAEANGKALQRLFNEAKASEGSKTIVIPKGVYRFALKGGSHLEKIKDLTFDGQGSEFIFQRLYVGQLFLFTDCERVVFKNLTLDWNWDYKPIASIGTVDSISEDHLKAEIIFPHLNPERTKLAAAEPWMGMFPIDPDTLYRNKKPEPQGFSIGKAPQVTASGNRATVIFAAPIALEKGESYLIRHHYYDLLGFKMADCRHLTFDGITIHSLPGMGWLNTGATQHWQFLNCRIVRREGSKHPFTTSADGIHTNTSNGGLIIRNCEFSGLGDDAINLHDNAWQGGFVRGENDRQLEFLNCPKHRLNVQAGDKLRFYNPDFSPSGVELQVAGEPIYVGKPNAYAQTATMTVQFTTAVPRELSRQSVAINTRFQTRNVLISGCRFTNLFGRAILFAGHDATIEKNTFRNIYSTAIQVQTDIVDNHWGEGHGSSNIVIRDNVLENTSWANRWEGAVIYTENRIPWGPTQHPLYDTFLIENNHFINSPGPAMSLNFSRNFVVRDNTIELADLPPNHSPYAGNISLNLSSKMAISGNTWINRIEPFHPTGLTYPAGTESIEFSGNHLKNMFSPAVQSENPPNDTPVTPAGLPVPTP